MSIELWRGPGGTAGHPRSGVFTDATNWSDGAVPTGATGAVLGAGKYVVTLSNAAVSMGGLQVGAGVTLLVDKQSAATSFLGLNADSVNAGRLLLSGGSVGISSSVTLVNYGQIVGGAGFQDPFFQGGGLLVNDGLIADAGGAGAANLVFYMAVNNDDDGVVNTQGGGKVIFAGSVINTGLISATNGGLITFNGAGAGSTDNLSGGELSGGHWSAVGAGSRLSLYNSEIDHLTGGAVVTLDGDGSALFGEDAGGVYSIESTLNFIDIGAELHVLGGRYYGTTNDIEVDGLLELGGGKFVANSIVVDGDPGSQLAGFGEIDAGVTIYGALRAAKTKTGEALVLTQDSDISGTLVGKGTLEISDGTTTLEDGAKVFVKDLVVSGQHGVLQLAEDLVYDGKLTTTDAGTVDLNGHVLRLSGKVTMDGGLLENGQIQLEGGQMTVTSGFIFGSLRNDGVVNVKNGGLFVEGAVNGAGEFHIGAGSELDLGVASAGQNVFMDGADATLGVYSATGFKGDVHGFAAGDTLIFGVVDYDPAATTLTWKADASGGGTLTLVNGAEKESIHLNGTYQKSLFHLGPADDDGTNVTYGAAAGPGHTVEAWDHGGGWAI